MVRHTHHDVDQENQHVWEHQWDQFLTDFYLVCHENAKIQVYSMSRNTLDDEKIQQAQTFHVCHPDNISFFSLLLRKVLKHRHHYLLTVVIHWTIS